jgi:hypothetical protein
MKTSDIKNDLIDRIVDACKKHIYRIKLELVGQVVFSYTIHCSSGCRNLGVALCTRNGLNSRNLKVSDPNEPSWYGEVNSAEWDHVNDHYNLFAEVDCFINRLYDIFYDEELDDIDLDGLDDDEIWKFISAFFIDAVVNSFALLKESKCFESETFEDDLLIGIQFSDPDKLTIKMIEESSKKLNSDEWHDKIKMNCEMIKRNESP